MPPSSAPGERSKPATRPRSTSTRGPWHSDDERLHGVAGTAATRHASDCAIVALRGGSEQRGRHLACDEHGGPQRCTVEDARLADAAVAAMWQPAAGPGRRQLVQLPRLLPSVPLSLHALRTRCCHHPGRRPHTLTPDQAAVAGQRPGSGPGTWPRERRSRGVRGRSPRILVTGGSTHRRRTLCRGCLAHAARRGHALTRTRARARTRTLDLSLILTLTRSRAARRPSAPAAGIDAALPHQLLARRARRAPPLLAWRARRAPPLLARRGPPLTREGPGLQRCRR